MSRGNRTFAFAIALAFIVLMGWVGWFELQNWQAARDRGMAFVAARADVMAENTARAIEVADTALRSVQSALEWDTANGASSQIQMMPHLRSLISALPQLLSLALVDREGVIRLSSLYGLVTTPLVVSDRDYFTAFRDNPKRTQLFVGEPAQTRRDGRWFIGMTRPVFDADKSFQGVVLASLNIEWMRDQQRQMSAADDISVALISPRGRIISAYLRNEDKAIFSGRLVTDVPELSSVPLSHVSDDMPMGVETFEAVDNEGNSMGAAAVKRVPGLPMMVVVLRPWETIFSDFKQDLVRDIGLLTVAVIVLLGMWGPVSRAMRDRDRLFDLSPDPVCITDGAGYFLRANPAWQKALGYSEEELASTSHLDLVHPLDREDARRLQARLLAGESVLDVPLRYKGRNGDSVWLAWSAVGEGGRVFAIARDITRRRDTERALAKSEARFRDVAEALGEFIWEIDERGNLIYLSERARSTLGIPPSELLGYPMTSLFDGTSADRFSQVRKRGTPFVMEMVAKRWIQNDTTTTFEQAQDMSAPDADRLIWLRLSGVPVHGADGALAGFRGAGVDITESKVSRQALADSEARYRSIVNTVVDGIITLDERGVMQSINPAAEAIFGYSARELVGRPLELLIPQDEQDGEAVNSSVQGEEGSLFSSTGHKLVSCSGKETVGHRKDGSSFFIELGISEVYFGAHRFFICMCRDVSERKRVERLKDEFVSTVSHELRTPLTSIRGSLGLIAGGAVGDVPGKVKRLVEIAHSNCERLVNLVNDILDIQKIEAGGMAFDMTRVDLVGVAHRAIDENTSFAQSFDVSVTLETPLRSLHVRGDFNRLLQVVTNLLSNAVKFSPKGESVIIRIGLDETSVVLEVEDHGPGISEEFRPRVFEKFCQADATDTRAKGGTGLGLSISRAIAERLGGELTFDSIPGHGATFVLKMPVDPDELDLARHAVLQAQQDVEGAVMAISDGALPIRASLEERKESTREFGLYHASGDDGEGETPRIGTLSKVLVIEDDPDVGHLMQMLLAEDGFLGDLARTAREAHEKLEHGRYAAITMDVMLPDANGLSFAAELRAQEGLSDVPIIVVSATADETARRLEGAALGIVDWIGKPINEDRLRLALMASVRRKHDEESPLPRVLHVEDDEELRSIVSEILSGRAVVEGAGGVADARRKLEDQTWDVVVLDFALPDGDGRDLLAQLSLQDGAPRVVIFSGSAATTEDAHCVSAALQKASVNNEELVRTILKVAELRHGLTG